jgi:hypothetical protein
VGVLAAAAVPAALAQSQGDIAVIVHPGVPVDDLSLADLRRMLTGDREFWSGSGRVTIFIRALERIHDRASEPHARRDWVRSGPGDLEVRESDQDRRPCSRPKRLSFAIAHFVNRNRSKLFQSS